MSNINFPITFNVLAIERAGAPVSLQQKSIESLNDDEVLIRVSYASINKMDPLLAHRNLFKLPEPYVPASAPSATMSPLKSKPST